MTEHEMKFLTEHMADVSVCPFCEAVRRMGIFKIEAVQLEVHIDAACAECGQSWRDIFSHTATEPLPWKGVEIRQFICDEIQKLEEVDK